MAILPSNPARTTLWSWWFCGLFVIPLCVNLLAWVPYQILVDRDLQLHGVRVEARITAARDAYTKRGMVREYRYSYVVDGDERGLWLGSTTPLRVGDVESLEYSPMFPWQAHKPITTAPWDQNLAWRLATSFGLACLFGTAWITGLRKAMRDAKDGSPKPSGA